MTRLVDMTPDELHEEIQVAAAHGRVRRFWRLLELWTEKVGWTTEDLARHIAREFQARLH